MSNTSVDTCCYVTQFVCRFDQLNEAKGRYLQAVAKVKEKYEVLLVSEQAYVTDNESILFENLIMEIECFDPPFNAEKREEYSAFLFTTIVLVPEGEGDDDAEHAREVADLLDLDREDEFPAVVPSRTRLLLMSATGEESDECLYQ